MFSVRKLACLLVASTVLLVNMGTSCGVAFPTPVPGLFGIVSGPIGGGTDQSGTPNASQMPQPIANGGFTINGILFPGGVFNWSGGNATFCFTDVFHCKLGTISATAQVNGPGAWDDNRNPGPVVAHENLSCTNLCLSWLPPAPGRYTIILQDGVDGHHAQVWVLVIVLANNPNPPTTPTSPGTLVLNLNSPTNMQTVSAGNTVSFSGTIVGGSPPFFLELDLYDNQRFDYPLGNQRTFAVDHVLQVTTTDFKDNLVQISSGDGQIDNTIVKLKINP